MRHQGDTATKAVQRDADHVNLWRSELTLERERTAAAADRFRRVLEERNATITQANTLIGELRTTIGDGVEKAPPEAVERWWTDRKVAELQEERDRAYRSRDQAYRALWALNHLHRNNENGDGRCICSRRAEACKELAALKPIAEGLARWEETQIIRLQRGLRHQLPDEHPEVLRRGPARRGSW
jgi:hypothetical protein